MKLSTLRYFVAIAKYGSYTKASELLLISQPSLSRQIQDLEEELGVQLLVRDRKKVKLTEDGELLFHEASAIIERCDRLPDLFRVRGGAEPRRTPQILKIGYQRFFNTQWIYQAMNRIRQETPGADVLLTQGTVEELQKGLKTSHYDAIFTLQVYAENLNGNLAVPFRGNRLQLMVPAQHYLASKSLVKFQELEGEEFILLQRQYSPVIVDYVISLCVKNGFSPNCSHYVSSAEEGLELVGAGKGVSFLHSEMNIEGLEKKYNVKFLDLDEKEARLDFVMVYKKQNQNPLLRQLIAGFE